MTKRINLTRADNYLYQLSVKHNIPKPKFLVRFVNKIGNIRIQKMVEVNDAQDLLVVTFPIGRKTILRETLDWFFEEYLETYRKTGHFHDGVAG